jgi:hypothetical protein
MIKQRVVQNESLRGHWSGHNLIPEIPSSPGMTAQYRLYLFIRMLPDDVSADL